GSAGRERDVVEQEAGGIAEGAVVVVVEPEHDGLPGVRRNVERGLGPVARAGGTDVEQRRQRRAGSAPDLRLDLVEVDRVGAERPVPERQETAPAPVAARK